MQVRNAEAQEQLWKATAAETQRNLPGLTGVAKGGDDLVHESLQDLSCCAGGVGDNGLPHVHSRLSHGVAHICSGHKQQGQHLQFISTLVMHDLSTPRSAS